MKKVKIGIVGCGSIGLYLAKSVEIRFKKRAVLTAVCDINKGRTERFLNKIKSKPVACSLKELIKRCDFIVEAASIDVSGEVAKRALLANKSVLVMSVGGLLNVRNILNLTKNKKSNIYIPSGALVGLDGIKGAVCGRIDKVALTTRKPPSALEGAPYLIENNINISSIKEEIVVFEGTVEEAVRGFPKNINVAATLRLICDVGARCSVPLHVRIIAAPGLTTNIHEIEVEGDFGKLFTRTENIPSPDNPKTSFLAALSAVATLEGALDNVKIGT